MHDFKSVRLAAFSALFVCANGLCAQELAEQTQAVQAADIPATEAHIRKGIIQLNDLMQCLYAIDNPQKADEAALKILEYQIKLIEWAQGFQALVKDDMEVQRSYEKAYMPIIKKINDQLQLQSERLNAAEYYKSRKLAAALVQLVESTN